MNTRIAVNSSEVETGPSTSRFAAVIRALSNCKCAAEAGTFGLGGLKYLRNESANWAGDFSFPTYIPRYVALDARPYYQLHN